MLRTIRAAIAALFLLAGIAGAQTPSGLLTGPVTYTSNLTSGNIYGDNTVWTLADNSTCSASGKGPLGTTIPNCYIVHYDAGTPYENLQASDGTSNGIPDCYTWDVSQLILNDVGYCQTSFHGGGSGETRVALYCSNTTTSDANGVYTLDCLAGWDGTAITVINGVDVPIPTQYNVNVTIKYHPVQIWIYVYRRGRQLQTWQKIDSAVVTVAPITD